METTPEWLFNGVKHHEPSKCDGANSEFKAFHADESPLHEVIKLQQFF